jgi:endonuclease/exonuclease/phosphatase family metal-dependent hydrolase
VVGTRQRGTLGLAVLSRLPLRGASRLSLGQLLRDPSMRGAIVVEVELPDGLLTVVGTHLAHLSNGSLIQLRALRRLIPGPATPAVLAGDMNLWGPPLSAMLPGWSRTVRARSWPAWRPMAQLDHVLVTPALRVDGRGEVLALGGSDHLPVRSRLSLR